MPLPAGSGRSAALPAPAPPAPPNGICQGTRPRPAPAVSGHGRRRLRTGPAHAADTAHRRGPTAAEGGTSDGWEGGQAQAPNTPQANGTQAAGAGTKGWSTDLRKLPTSGPLQRRMVFEYVVARRRRRTPLLPHSGITPRTPRTPGRDAESDGEADPPVQARGRAPLQLEFGIERHQHGAPVLRGSTRTDGLGVRGEEGTACPPVGYMLPRCPSATRRQGTDLPVACHAQQRRRLHRRPMEPE